MPSQFELYLSILRKFINREINLDELYDQFYMDYMDNDCELDSHQENFISDICEKMDFTADKGEPDAEDRKYGWINADELRNWIRNYIEASKSLTTKRND